MTRSGGRGSAGRAALLIRGALWPIPCLGVFLAVGLGVLLPALDGWWQRSGDDPLGFAFGGGASAARDLLSAIAGSLISVTGLVFSLTVVALQLSSSQYSPRLLQTFVTDRAVQVTLAQLVMTFVYALTVLRTVRTESGTEDDTAFVPRLSITVAYLLTLGSVVALVFFLGHLARALRVETMLRDVHDEASRTIGRQLGDDGAGPGAGAPREPLPFRPVGRALLVPARGSGFLIEVDEQQAAAAAREVGVTIRLVARTGDAVVAGTPVACAWPDTPGGSVDTEALADALHPAIRLGYERSADRDVAYGLRKVVDIVVRALSPGTNDPTTAVHGLSHVSALLGELAARPAVERRIDDRDGVLRVLLPAWDLPLLLQVALEEPLICAEGQPAVLRRLASLLRETAWLARGRGVDDLLIHYTERVVDLAERTAAVSTDEGRSWQLRVSRALAGEWPLEPL